jgi:hypothetical protein
MSTGEAVQNGTGTWPPSVELGEHSYTIYPQRHAYLTHKLGNALADLQDAEALGAEGIEDFVSVLGTRAYGLLRVFIPALMPEYEFRGFATEEAMADDAYDEQYDRSPTFAQIVEAFQLGLKVNRLDLLKNLGKVVNAELMQAYVTKFMVDFFESRQQESSS